MKSEVQVLAGPPTNPAGQSVAAIQPAALSAFLVHIEAYYLGQTTIPRPDYLRWIIEQTAPPVEDAAS